MTAPGGRPAIDPGNPYLAPVQCDLAASRMRIPGPEQGQWQEVAVLTLRAGPATVTVMLVKDELSAWIGSLEATRDKMTGLVVGGPGPFPPGNGHPS
jgi:hypothetical protein